MIAIGLVSRRFSAVGNGAHTSMVAPARCDVAVLANVRALVQLTEIRTASISAVIRQRPILDFRRDAPN
jgi:hypothetical protein